MKKTAITIAIGAMLFAGTGSTEDKGLTVSEQSTMSALLASRSGTRVTLRLSSGQELTGVLGAVGPQVVHLRELSGREFFDAAIAVAHIEGLIVRNR